MIFGFPLLTLILAIFTNKSSGLIHYFRIMLYFFKDFITFNFENLPKIQRNSNI